MTKMPAVRIEVGYLSNTLDAKKLSDAQNRDLIAASIAEAIITFFEPRFLNKGLYIEVKFEENK